MPSLAATHETPRRAARWLLLVALLATPTAASADVTAAPATPAADQAAAETPPAAEEIPEAMRHPRAVLEAFISLMREDKKKEAAQLLDLSQLAAIAAESRGPDLSLKLYQLLPALGDPPTRNGDDMLDAWIAGQVSELDFSEVPNKPEFAGPYPLTDWLSNPREGADKLSIARDLKGRWKFSSETVAQIDTLYEATEQRIDQIAEEKAEITPVIEGEEPTEPTETFGVWLRKLFPPAWRKTYFLLPTYQWVLLLLLIPIGRLVEKLVRSVMTWVGDYVLRRLDKDYEKGETTRGVWRPVGRLAAAGVWTLGAYLLELPSDVTNVLLTVLIVVAIVAAVLALFRVLDLVAGYLSRRAKRRERKFDDLIVPLMTTVAKIAVVLVGVVAVIASLNDELPATLIGGLGIGGIAIALASQETLSNFIGSITLLMDRPFEVGDFIKFDGVEGEIESLGFRSTRLRTPLNSQVTVPNSKLAGTIVDNWGRRRYRRYLAKVGLEYGTPPERIEAFCEGVRELIRRHPHTRKDFYAAYFNEFGPSSLDILVVVFFEVPDWPTELRERHRLLADMARLADSIGVSFAFPTQTLHLHRGEEDGPPPELADTKPGMAGAKAAAEIAGELANYQDRPGRVKFSGPTEVK